MKHEGVPLLQRAKATIKRRAIRLKTKLFPPIDERQFSKRGLILHFSYHKCLTVYYDTVMSSLADEFGFLYRHFNSNVRRFDEVVKEKKTGVFSVNNYSNIDFEQFPPYRGTHFIRDPRDLIVSGYKYHLWTKEKWCVDPNFDWRGLTGNPEFSQYIENDPARYPSFISYQQYLKALNKEKGLILETLWRNKFLTEMRNWDYTNDDILEIKYEQVVGREAEVFSRIFDHYELHPLVFNRALELVKENSLEKKANAGLKHVGSGQLNQWKEHFTDLNSAIFKKLQPGLLEKLGYEPNDSW